MPIWDTDAWEDDTWTDDKDEEECKGVSLFIRKKFYWSQFGFLLTYHDLVCIVFIL